MKTLLTLATALLTLAASQAPSTAGASEAEPVKFVVLIEGGAGSSRAQTHLDALLAVAAKHNGWTKVDSLYSNRRKRAKSYITSDKPQLGLISLAAYLQMLATHQLEVVGQALTTSAGGRQYFVIGKSGADLSACKGKTLASNHLEDARFVDNVLFGHAARLSEFQATPTRRPVQTLKKVIRDQAACALIDDAQLSTLEGLEGAEEVKTLWKSAKLPPIPMVAFPDAPPALVAGFKSSLPKICSGDDQEVCSNIGVQKLRAASNADYRDVISIYQSNKIASP